MMKRVLLTGWIMFISLAVSAQDFVTRFLDKREPDAHLICVSVSPKMMQEVLKIDVVEENNDLLNMISNLKSMQMLTSEVEGAKYFKEALGILDKNSERFKIFGSYDGNSENYRTMVRKRKNEIVELVMLVNDNNKFVVINFTGNMNDKFISRVVDSMKIKRS